MGRMKTTLFDVDAESFDNMLDKNESLSVLVPLFSLRNSCRHFVGSSLLRVLCMLDSSAWKRIQHGFYGVSVPLGNNQPKRLCAAGKEIISYKS